MYAKSFNFERYVRYQTPVELIEPAHDYDATGRWRVVAKSLVDGQVTDEIFDGVMIGTGHHGTVQQPTFPGQEKFKGEIIHTHSLKSAKGYEDKTVVVVGIGNSGGDAVVETSSVAKQVYLSTRRGCWVFHRVSTNGRPFDYLFLTRINDLLSKWLPYNYYCSIYEAELNKKFNHHEYQLKPEHRVFSQHITVNDALSNKILAGMVKVKNNIDHFTEDGVVFEGETEVTPCDSVILATGYKIEFPFLSQKVMPTKSGNKIRLFKHQFIHSLKHPETLAFISLIQPIGPILPIGELQSRWFAMLNAGKVQLPSKQEMEEDIRRKAEFQKRFYESERHTIQVDWVDFMTELATQIGANPPLWKYALTDWTLFKKLAFGPVVPYQFRLTGPNAWAGARDAIMGVDDRILAALKTKPPKDGNNNTQNKSTQKAKKLD